MHPSEAKLMELLKVNKELKASEVAPKLNMNKGAVGRIAYSLSKKGLVEMEKEETRKVVLTSEGKKVKDGKIPEKALLQKMPVDPKKLKGLDKIALNWALKRRWVEMEGDKAVRVVRKLPVTDEEVALKSWDTIKHNSRNFKLLRKRKWVKTEKDVDYTIKLTEKGEDAKIDTQATQVTPEILRSGKWKKTKFMPFSPDTPVPSQYAGRIHPLNDIIEKIRRVFLEMGFKEAEGPLIESAFWDLDALFVPQDHPAREMQDTFYMEGKAEVPRDIARQVSKVHRGHWGTWSKKEASRKLLRTHTTSVSAHKLTEIEPPAKFFCVGRVFRNETVDYKHTAEFYQVEGIVVDPDVNFNNLVGYLRDFFQKLGIPKIRVRPGYFPYTELSAEVDIWFEPQEAWMELGGAGIFRPEVVKPLLGKDIPVLAWGLGIERIAMLNYDLDDIRKLYQSDIDWLRNREVFL